MPFTPSPLRYPGGKTALAALTAQLLTENGLARGTYAEPFAGGGGLALQLLYEGVARRIALNDLDPGIFAFWDSVVRRSSEMIRLIRETPVTMDEWYRQREIYRGTEEASLELGFATLFLNRTNRSGVIKGGVIGGYAQSGAYKLDCRFNRDDLVDKVERIARYRGAITITRLDGEEFLRAPIEDRGRIAYFIDPPYFHKGSGLYSNYYSKKDHASLAATIADLEQPWILTYDHTPEIKQLYRGHSQYRFDLNYTAAVKRVGTELMVLSDQFTRVPTGRLQLDPIEIAHAS